MKQLLKRMSLLAATGVSTLALGGGVALAQSSGTMYQANLSALNGSETTGTAMVEVNGNEVTVTVNTTSASPGLPHAQHIHIGGNNVCPSPDAAGEDNLINSVEGQPSYGEIRVSLTTEGDVGTDSSLAVDRMPVASDDGMVTYERTFTLPEGVNASDLENGVIVQHGISELFNDKAKYDGDQKSPLNEELPLEATIPAACGELTAAPEGGAGAGSGDTAGMENLGMAVAGASAVVAGATLAATRKSASEQ